MAITAYNISQTVSRSLPFLAAASATLVIPEVRAEAKDAYQRIFHRPELRMEVKKPNQIILWAPIAGLAWLIVKYLPEITGSVPHRAIIDKAAKKEKIRKAHEKRPPQPPATSNLLLSSLKNELNSFTHLSDAVRRENELKTQLRNNWVLKGGKLVQKTPEELARDKKLIEAIKFHLDWVFHNNGRKLEEPEPGWFEDWFGLGGGEDYV
jgi:hypothetical protein